MWNEVSTERINAVIIAIRFYSGKYLLSPGCVIGFVPGGQNVSKTWDAYLKWTSLVKLPERVSMALALKLIGGIDLINQSDRHLT
jgi:hypothetical protein